MTPRQYLPGTVPWELVQRQEMVVYLLVFVGVKKPVVLSPSGLGSSGQGLSVLISASPRGE